MEDFRVAVEFPAAVHAIVLPYQPSLTSYERPPDISTDMGDPGINLGPKIKGAQEM